MVAVLTITPQIYDLVLSSFEFHPVLVSPVTFSSSSWLCKPLLEKWGLFPLCYEQIAAACLLCIPRSLAKTLKKTDPGLLPVASPQTDSSPFIKTHCSLFFTYFLPAWSSAVWALILPSLCSWKTLWAGSGSLKAGSTGITLPYWNWLLSPHAFDFSDGGDGSA